MHVPRKLTDVAGRRCDGRVRLRVMSFNAWGAGSNEAKTVDETVAIIRASEADIVGLQETRPETELGRVHSSRLAQGTAAKIARALGFYWHNQTRTVNEAKWANAVLSRFPIEASTQHDLGVRIRVPSTACATAGARTVLVFNVQLPDCPFQPFQVSGLPYCGAPAVSTAAGAVAAAHAARDPALRALLEDMDASFLAPDAADAAFVLGDLNEPSHRDWTARAAAAGMYPLAVRFPTAKAIEARGFVDTYRAVKPHEVEWPGHTWPTRGRHEPCTARTGTRRRRRRCAEVQRDRIDYVFARGLRRPLVVEDAWLLGETARAGADVAVVSPWPSDHRAVVATVSLH